MRKMRQTQRYMRGNGRQLTQDQIRIKMIDMLRYDYRYKEFDLIDFRCLEVNTTKLVEHFCNFGPGKENWLDDNQHFVWDAAVDAAEIFEPRMRKEYEDG